MRTVCAPAGTPNKRKDPSAAVSVEMLVPTTDTVARSRIFPVDWLETEPMTVPVPEDCARTLGTLKSVTSVIPYAISREIARVTGRGQTVLRVFIGWLRLV